jgi:hypothetical protein
MKFSSGLEDQNSAFKAGEEAKRAEVFQSSYYTVKAAAGYASLAARTSFTQPGIRGVHAGWRVAYREGIIRG